MEPGFRAIRIIVFGLLAGMLPVHGAFASSEFDCVEEQLVSTIEPPRHIIPIQEIEYQGKHYRKIDVVLTHQWESRAQFTDTDGTHLINDPKPSLRMLVHGEWITGQITNLSDFEGPHYRVSPHGGRQAPSLDEANHLRGTGFTFTRTGSSRSEFVSLNDVQELELSEHPKEKPKPAKPEEPVDLDRLKHRQPLQVDQIDWANEYHLLRYRLAHGQETFDQLRIPSPQIKKIGKSIGDGGVSNWGVFTVETPQGTKVLKFVSRPPDVRDGTYRDYSRDQAIIQMHLAELHSTKDSVVAVPIDGVIDEAGVQDILNRFPEVRPQGRRPHVDPKWAILMDYVPEGWNAKAPGGDMAIKLYPPEHAKSWDTQAILQKILADDIVTKRLGLKITDWQNIVTKDGKSFLFDFENTTADPNSTPPPAPKSVTVEGLQGNHQPWEFNEAATHIRKFRELLNPFFDGGAQSQLKKEGLDWHALNILRGDPTLDPGLRQIAQELFEKIQIPQHYEPFGARIRDANSDQRTIYALEYLIESFSGANYSHFRSLLTDDLHRLRSSH
jgi:hypothetical protein